MRSRESTAILGAPQYQVTKGSGVELCDGRVMYLGSISRQVASFYEPCTSMWSSQAWSIPPRREPLVFDVEGYGLLVGGGQTQSGGFLSDLWLVTPGG